MNEAGKLEAARAALGEISSGMRLGLGTGSTAKHFVDLLGEKVSQGFECICVPTSIATEQQALSLKIPLTDLDAIGELDVTIDGADELDSDLNLIKGGGGALLREKIVAAASKRMVVIADGTKRVDVLGQFPLPVEVNVFGVGVTTNAVKSIALKHGAQGDVKLRTKQDGTAFLTDGGHFILDAFFGRISDANSLSNDLLDIPGVVQHGLFLKMCQVAYVAGQDGVTKYNA